MTGNTLLVIGNAKSTLLQALAKELKKRQVFDRIDIFSNTKYVDTTAFDHHYYISFSWADKLHDANPIKRFILPFLFLVRALSMPSYSIVHVHYASKYNLFKSMLFARAKKVLTIWGSDYMRASPSKKKRILSLSKKIDIISCTNEELKDELSNYFDQNVYVTRFGLNLFERLEQFNTQKDDAKRALNIDPSTFVVQIGYNADPNQQHLKVIEAIKNIEQKERFTLLLPLTYKGSHEYKEAVINAAKSNGFTCIAFTSFLSDVAWLNCIRSVDIMIQVQTTDQFSGAMQEHLFDGNHVITGSWLPYNLLKQKGILFDQIAQFDDLPITISRAVENYSTNRSARKKNAPLMYAISAWDNTIDDWLKLYAL